ncbi:hypothetical protein H4J51_03335 [Colwellia sp. MB02u-18]|uniref:hypothetical protein n=1 Tax=unclassified Colwellia TaxID=196834 RepID=UPI0015F3C929|nr:MULTISPECIES: hypothetical protein [unclassified Colwellia]MBA6224739.1 hypothetical protein [Colwellia sp. MB3u-45]MBA6266809.1 hypothetical protein [Colwellia sp. MB3u-43]MBA6321404.1 hypothetical protein [Colwellia sp. MB02u-19]MBA6323611.1 hypothetical protein [Colwellia sp. MB02u-18]MBA6332432.1 hypothetical protein [Colwellia sp. MB02u-12]
MFESTQNILEKTEGYILNLPSDNKLWSLFTRYIVFPLKYLWLGLGEFLKPASLWAVIAFLLMIAVTMAKKNFGINHEYSFLMINFCIYFPMILVIFAVPSTYSYFGVSSAHVKKTTQIIEAEGIDSIDKVELLEENIEKIYDRVCSRVLFYKWLVGASWTLYVVVFNFELRFLMKSSGQSIKDAISENMLTFFLVLFSAIGALLLVVGYKKASDLLIKSIEFGCVEQKYKLLKMPNKQINKD